MSTSDDSENFRLDKSMTPTTLAPSKTVLKTSQWENILPTENGASTKSPIRNSSPKPKVTSKTRSDEDADWRERTEVLTKVDHEEHVALASEVLSTLLSGLPTASPEGADTISERSYISVTSEINVSDSSYKTAVEELQLEQELDSSSVTEASSILTESTTPFARNSSPNCFLEARSEKLDSPTHTAQVLNADAAESSFSELDSIVGHLERLDLNTTCSYSPGEASSAQFKDKDDDSGHDSEPFADIAVNASYDINNTSYDIIEFPLPAEFLDTQSVPSDSPAKTSAPVNVAAPIEDEAAPQLPKTNESTLPSEFVLPTSADANECKSPVNPPAKERITTLLGNKELEAPTSLEVNEFVAQAPLEVGDCEVPTVEANGADLVSTYTLVHSVPSLHELDKIAVTDLASGCALSSTVVVNDATCSESLNSIEFLEDISVEANADLAVVVLPAAPADLEHTVAELLGYEEITEQLVTDLASEFAVPSTVVGNDATCSESLNSNEILEDVSVEANADLAVVVLRAVPADLERTVAELLGFEETTEQLVPEASDLPDTASLTGVKQLGEPATLNCERILSVQPVEKPSDPASSEPSELTASAAQELSDRVFPELSESVSPSSLLEDPVVPSPDPSTPSPEPSSPSAPSSPELSELVSPSSLLEDPVVPSPDPSTPSPDTSSPSAPASPELSEPVVPVFPELSEPVVSSPELSEPAAPATEEISEPATPSSEDLGEPVALAVPDLSEPITRALLELYQPSSQTLPELSNSAASVSVEQDNPAAPASEELSEPVPASEELGEPAVPAFELCEPAVPASEELGEPVVPASEELGEPVVPASEDLCEPAAPASEDLCEPAAPASEELGELAVPAFELCEPVVPASEELSEPVVPASEELSEPAAPASEELSEPAAPASEDLCEPAAPASEELGELAVPAFELCEPVVPASEELSEPAAPAYEELSEPAAPAYEELSEPVVPASEELSEPVVPASEELSEPVVSVPEELCEPAAPSSEELGEPAAPASEELGEPVAPASEELGEPAAPASEELGEPVAPASEELSEPAAPASEELSEPAAPASEELSEPAAPASEELSEPAAPASEELSEPAAPASEELSEPVASTFPELGEPFVPAFAALGEPSFPASPEFSEPVALTSTEFSDIFASTVSADSDAQGKSAQSFDYLTKLFNDSGAFEDDISRIIGLLASENPAAPMPSAESQTMADAQNNTLVASSQRPDLDNNADELDSRPKPEIADNANGQSPDKCSDLVLSPQDNSSREDSTHGQGEHVFKAPYPQNAGPSPMSDATESGDLPIQPCLLDSTMSLDSGIDDLNNTKQRNGTSTVDSIVPEVKGSTHTTANFSEAGPDVADLRQEEFKSATDFFMDGKGLDFLEKNHGKQDVDSALARMSLYVKFDPCLPERARVVNQWLSTCGQPENAAEKEASSPHRTPGATVPLPENLKLIDLSHSPNETQRIEAPLQSSPAAGAATATPETSPLPDQEVRRMLAVQELLFQERLLMKDVEYDKKVKHLEKENAQLRSQVQEVRQSQGEMTQVVCEYEKTLTQMIADSDRQKQLAVDSAQQLTKERDQALEDMQNVEAAFGDLHRRYEKLKKAVEGFKKNEETLTKCLADFQETIKTQNERYEMLRVRAEERLESASLEIDNVRKNGESEIAALRAQLKMAEMRIDGLERALEQKGKENSELTNICDELIAQVGKSS